MAMADQTVPMGLQKHSTKNVGMSQNLVKLQATTVLHLRG